MNKLVIYKCQLKNKINKYQQLKKCHNKYPDYFKYVPLYDGLLWLHSYTGYKGWDFFKVFGQQFHNTIEM